MGGKQMMRIDLGMALGIALEYIFFIYYADTLFYQKRSKWLCYFIIAINYLIHFLICTFGNGTLNIIVFTIINLLCFILCYHIKFKNALFQTFILVILSIASELLIITIPHINIMPNNTVNMSATQSIFLTLTSKSLYLIGMLIINKLSFSDNKNYGVSPVALISIPTITIAILILIFETNIASHSLSIVCFLLMLINCILLFINKRMTNKDLEISELKSEQTKENLQLEHYLSLKEKDEKLRILHHDLKEHLMAVASLVSKNDGNNTEALEYIKSLCIEEESSQAVDYSDNFMLNWLLTKRKDECLEKRIDFKINPIQAQLSFINHLDVVSLFSNLINNAVEGCENSDIKRIHLDIHMSNDNYVIINMENSSDTEPLVIDGRLRTHKDNKNLHGIGMNSIRRTLKKYDGNLKWAYDPKDKIFCTTIIMQNNTAKTTIQAI